MLSSIASAPPATAFRRGARVVSASTSALLGAASCSPVPPSGRGRIGGRACGEVKELGEFDVCAATHDKNARQERKRRSRVTASGVTRCGTESAERSGLAVSTPRCSPGLALLPRPPAGSTSYGSAQALPLGAGEFTIRTGTATTPDVSNAASGPRREDHSLRKYGMTLAQFRSKAGSPSRPVQARAPSVAQPKRPTTRPTGSRGRPTTSSSTWRT